MTRALHRLIFAACRQLGLDDAARHDLQVSVTGKASLRDMTQAELTLVVDRLKTHGFKPVSKAHSNRQKYPRAPRADLRLVHVLWRKLGEAGALREPGRAGLNRFIRARFGKVWGSVPGDVDMLRDHEQINDVIRALKDWGQRSEIDFDWQDHRTPLGDCRQSPAGRASQGDTRT